MRNTNRKSGGIGRIWERILILLLAVVLGFQCSTFGHYYRVAHPKPEETIGTIPTTKPVEPETTAPVTETTAPATKSEAELREERAEELLGEMTLDEKIWQMFIVTHEQLEGVPADDYQTSSGENTKLSIQEKRPVGGVVYFRENLKNEDQIKNKLIGRLQSYSKLGLFICLDEEGGQVVRLGGRDLGVKDFGPMFEIGKTENNVEKAYEVGKTLGEQLGELGFNMDLAPVADVRTNPNNKVIGNRAFSDDPVLAGEMVAECVRGFKDADTLCTLKHFPGHGDTREDSHNGSASSSKTLEELEECELIPFQRGIEAGAPFVMMGHITLPEVTEEDVPATLSEEIVTELLRIEMGFEGLIITDAMDMRAITEHYDPDVAAVMAVQAGVDMILMPKELQKAFEGIKNAVADDTITEERIDDSVLRILMTKLEYGIID